MVWNVWCVHWPVNQSVKSPTCLRVFSQDLSSLVHSLLACPRKCPVSELFMNVHPKDMSSLSSWGVHVPGCQISEIWEDTSKLMRFPVCLLIYVWICVYISISMSISIYLSDLKVFMSRLWGYWALGGSFPLFWNLWPVWEDVPKYKLSDLLMGVCCKISGLWLVSGSFFS